MKKRSSRTPILLLLAAISFIFISYVTPISAEAAPSQTLDARNITLNSAQVWDTLSSTTYVYSDYLYLSTNYNDLINTNSIIFGKCLAKSENSRCNAKYLYWTLNNLTPNKTYYYRFAYKTSSLSAYTYSGIGSFSTTLPAPVNYSTYAADIITQTSVHIYANLPTTVKIKNCTGVVWEDTGMQCKQVYSKTDVTDSAMYFWYDVGGLKPNTKYGWSITYTDQYDRKIAASGTFRTLRCYPNSNNSSDYFYYYNGANNPNAGSNKYKLPNCTTYVFGRVYERTGVKPRLSGNGGQDYFNNGKSAGYSTSGDPLLPKEGAVICVTGHVGVVEYVGLDSQGRYVVWTESNYSGRNYPANRFNIVKAYLSSLQNSISSGSISVEYLEDSDGYNDEKKATINNRFIGYIYVE